MNKKIHFPPLLWLLLIITGGACTEVYDPDIVADRKLLVVESLITDEPGPYHVKLSNTVPFDSVRAYRGVGNAEVYVQDDLGNRFFFYEEDEGEYYSDASFQTDTAREYFLNIELNDQVYRSDTVKIKRTETEESGRGLFIKKEYLEQDVFNNNILVEEDWIEVYLNTVMKGNKIPGIRIEPYLIVFSSFTRDPNGGDDLIPHYAWRTILLDFELALSTEKDILVGQQGELIFNEQRVASFESRQYIRARDSVYLEYPDNPGTFYAQPVDTMNSVIVGYNLVLRQFHMNESSAAFYKSLEEQLNTGNRIFDPIPYQTESNIYCLTEPDLHVAGLFEVSAVNTTAFTLRTNYYLKEMEFFSIEPFLPDPPVGWKMDSPPDFWLNKYK